MASTFSDLKIELIGTGDQTGTWGTTTNNNFSIAFGEAITGSADVAFSSADVTVTLTDTNAAQTARNLRLNLTGTSGGARNLILGSGCQIEKLYLVNNGLADAVTVKNTTGTGIAVPAGKSMFVFNNGTNVIEAVNSAVTLDATTIDTTNLEVTNLKAKDGTAAGSIANSTGVVTLGSSVLTTTDINGGTIDGTTVGASTASTGRFSTLEYTSTLTGGTGVVNLGSGQFFKDASGNVGIGTSSPGNLLHIQGTGGAIPSQLRLGVTASNQFYDIGRDFNDGLCAFYGAQAAPFSGFKWFTAATERMRIDSSGNVGIGTASPASNSLSIVRGAGVSASIEICANGATPASTNSYTLLQGSDGEAYVFNRANRALIFGANNAERMRIDSSGNVGIGTSSPSARLQVAGSSIFEDTVQIFNNPTSSAQGILFRNTFNVGPSIFSMGAATTNGIINFVGGSGTQGAINGNGAGISYTSASDYRLKENIAPMTGALDVVAQLKPCTYTWKCNGSAGQGFIAHELQEFVPEAVAGEKDAVDADGNIKPQGIDTSFLVATLTCAIQEQQALITQLQADVAALKVQP